MAKKYNGDKPAKTPEMGQYEWFIADRFGDAVQDCIKEGNKQGLSKAQIFQVMEFALRTMGKQANMIIMTYNAQLSRQATDRINKLREKENKKASKKK